MCTLNALRVPDVEAIVVNLSHVQNDLARASAGTGEYISLGKSVQQVMDIVEGLRKDDESLGIGRYIARARLYLVGGLSNILEQKKKKKERQYVHSLSLTASSARGAV